MFSHFCSFNQQPWLPSWILILLLKGKLFVTTRSIVRFSSPENIYLDGSIVNIWQIEHESYKNPNFGFSTFSTADILKMAWEKPCIPQTFGVNILIVIETYIISKYCMFGKFKPVLILHLG